MAVDSFARRLAAAAIQKGGSDVTKDYVDSELEKNTTKPAELLLGTLPLLAILP